MEQVLNLDEIFILQPLCSVFGEKPISIQMEKSLEARKKFTMAINKGMNEPPLMLLLLLPLLPLLPDAQPFHFSPKQSF